MNALFERHQLDCTCSYCKGESQMRYGLNVPLLWKAWNSWWVVKLWPRRYFRWTNPWLRIFR